MTHNVEVPSTRIRGINDWFAQMPGTFVLDAEVEVLRRTLPDLFGYHLLQVGRLANVDMIGASRILNRMIVDIEDTTIETPYTMIRGTARALPIESDAVDVVVLPHVLEFETTPHEALREVQRVLVPEGHAVITGFNPWSFMGVWRAVLHRTRGAPWSGNFFGLNRIKDWLALLGFDVVDVQRLFFRPPFKNHRMMERLGVFERFAQNVPNSFGAGVYVLLARKRVSTLTPIKPKWSTRRRLVSVGIVEPTARVEDSEVRTPQLGLVEGSTVRSSK